MDESISHPFAQGDLTSDGVQYSTLHTTTTDAYEAVETVRVQAEKIGEVVEYEFGLTCSIQSSGATESVLFKWQAKNKKSATWVDLHSEVTYAADASALKEYTYSGRVAPQTNLDEGDIEVQLVIKSGGAGGETAKGKTKNSSYVKIKYTTS